MEAIFNTCYSLRDKLLCELYYIKNKLNPTNFVPSSHHAYFSSRAPEFRGSGIQTPGVNLHACFNDLESSQDSMLKFIDIVSEKFKLNCLKEEYFNEDLKPFFLEELKDVYTQSNTQPATMDLVLSFLDNWLIHQQIIPASSNLIVKRNVAKILVRMINENYHHFEETINDAQGFGLDCIWAFHLVSIINETLSTTQFSHVKISIDEIIIVVDNQLGKLNLFDLEAYRYVKVPKMINCDPIYQHAVSTQNMAYMEWEKFERRCQGIIQQTSTFDFPYFESSVQIAFEETLLNILDYHGAWPKQNFISN